MKREFLEGLGIESLTKEVIDSIMAENGKDIEREKTKTTTANEQITALTEQLNTAKDTLDKFKDVNVDELKGKITELTNGLAEKDTEYQANLAKVQRSGEIKEFFGGKKFVNDATREFYMGKIEAMVDEETSKGKSYDDLLNSLVKDEKGEFKPNIFISEESTGKGTGLEHGSQSNNMDDMSKWRAEAGLPPVKE